MFKLIYENIYYLYVELALRRDDGLHSLLLEFEAKLIDDTVFLERIHGFIERESEALYNDLFFDTTTDVGKQLSRNERSSKNLDEEKSLIYGKYLCLILSLVW